MEGMFFHRVLGKSIRQTVTKKYSVWSWHIIICARMSCKQLCEEPGTLSDLVSNREDKHGLIRGPGVREKALTFFARAQEKASHGRIYLNCILQ